MNVPTLAFVIRGRWLAIAAAALVASCGTPDNNDGSSGNDGGSMADSSLDGAAGSDSGSDAATDRVRMRDTGQPVNLDAAASQCLTSVMPRTGTSASTFVINGTGVLNATSVRLTINNDASPGTFVVDTMVPVTSGAFTYSVSGSMFSPGNYTVNSVDPTFTCSFAAPFTVTM